MIIVETGGHAGSMSERASHRDASESSQLNRAGNCERLAEPFLGGE